MSFTDWVRSIYLRRRHRARVFAAGQAVNDLRAAIALDDQLTGFSLTVFQGGAVVDAIPVDPIDGDPDATLRYSAAFARGPEAITIAATLARVTLHKDQTGGDRRDHFDEVWRAPDARPPHP